MQAEPGETSDRRSGTRAATTFRNEPSARPGASAIAASPMGRLSADGAGRLSYFVIVSVPSDAPVFGGNGAPTGMFVISGRGMNVALLKLASKLPRLIGPSTVTPFF